MLIKCANLFHFRNFQTEFLLFFSKNQKILQILSKLLSSQNGNLSLFKKLK